MKLSLQVTRHTFVSGWSRNTTNVTLKSWTPGIRVHGHRVIPQFAAGWLTTKGFSGLQPQNYL